MIALVAAISLAACTLWFLFPVCGIRIPRRPRDNGQVVSAAGPPPPRDVEVDDAGAPMWTALDEHQLTRLLKDSAPRP